MDDRVPRAAQDASRRLNVGGVALRSQPLDPTAPVEGGFVHLFQSHIRGNLHHHRANPSLVQTGKGTPHNLGSAGRRVYLLNILGDPGIVGNRIEVRDYPLPLPRFAQGEQKHGSGIGVGGRYARIGIFRPRAVLHGKDAGHFAIGYPAVTVGDSHAHPLLAADDGPDSGGGGGLNDRRGGKATEVFHAFPLENFGYGFNSVQLPTP